ncbi:MAG: hypothetical protein BWY68_00940 [bacterium ADurb.Bin400]|nr:MAG: hypothetical protein BWY68_00940 [bacterium ADurb.Bin400]
MMKILWLIPVCRKIVATESTTIAMGTRIVMIQIVPLILYVFCRKIVLMELTTTKMAMLTALILIVPAKSTVRAEFAAVRQPARITIFVALASAVLIILQKKPPIMIGEIIILMMI